MPDHTVFYALFEFVSDPLNAAPKRIERDTQLIGHRLSIVDLVTSFVFIIFQYQLTTLDCEFSETLLETLLLGALLVFNRLFCRYGVHLVETDLKIIGFLERFKKDETGNAITVSGNIQYLFFGFQFADHTIDSFIGALFGEMRAAPVEVFHKLAAYCLILLTSTIHVGIEAGEKPV